MRIPPKILERMKNLWGGGGKPEPSWELLVMQLVLPTELLVQVHLSTGAIDKLYIATNLASRTCPTRPSELQLYGYSPQNFTHLISPPLKLIRLNVLHPNI